MKTKQNGLGFERMPAILLLRLRSQNMTREVAKICEERAPWDKSSHFRIYAVLYSNTFRIIDDISSVLFLFVCFFFRQSIFHYRSNSISWIHIPKEILSQAFYTRNLRSASTTYLTCLSKFWVVGEKTQYFTSSDNVLIV